LGKYVSKHKIDVFHGIGGYMPASFPPEVKALRVISVISTAPLRYPDETNFIKNLRNGFQALRNVTRSSHFIVNSEQDRLFMQEKFRIRDSKLHVVHPALHPQFLSPEAIEPDHSNAFHYLPKRFILCTAKIKNSKEAEALIRAAYLDKNNEGLPIIFAARSHKGSENAKSLVKNLNIENKVLFVEGVSTGMMLFLFRRAELFLYPCKYETSAVPLFEAMACNIPVVASDIPVFRQYCGDQIHYFPDHSPEGIHHFIKQYREHQDLIRAKVVSAREHALNFSPQKFATDLMKVYRDSK
jgi:glycosyltransferase involved in cell wall biosynthesis